MSALLTTTMIQMKSYMQAFRDEGLLNGRKVMVGGAPVTHLFAEEIRADGFGRNATDAAETAIKLIETLKRHDE
jgi:methanogenic corrinoid protein MtbC1